MRAPLPVTDKNIARAYADAKANTLMHYAMTAMVEAVRTGDVTKPKTLQDLLTRYFEAYESDWTKTNRVGQANMRDFWLRELRGETLLTSVTPALVMAAVKRGSDAFKARSGKPWSNSTKRRHLIFIKAAFNHAVRIEKWITARHDLAAVELPAPDSENEHLTYTEEETAKLLPTLEKRCDVRAWAVAEIYACSGHRTNAIRHLETDQLEPFVREDGKTVFAVHWDRNKQKNRKGNYSVLSVDATRALQTLLDTPRVKACGKLFVTGNLNNPLPERGKYVPMLERYLLEELRKAEKLAEVATVKGRGFHGLKRRYATDALEIDANAAADQANTDADVLRKTYRQARVKRQAKLVIELEKIRA